MAGALHRSLRSGRVLVALALILLVAACALFAPLLAPHDPAEQNLLGILLPPAWQEGGDQSFSLGTDSLGRCILSRLIFGARTAMTVALVASLGAMAINPIAGLLMLIASFAGMLAGIVFARIAAELVLIAFRINEHLGAMRNRDGR